ncbi:helix-turn-helix domain-containing protein [Streptomyces sp. GD-15H]|uniref:helix-turn-helix domain-containing protein n=1 Tax=Streptomyces sp. GD-15H TaxID=3129112 RepID=UPI003253D9DD
MTDFDAIGALLAGARQEVPLPPADERRALREGLSVSCAQLARALNVSPSTVGGWESGREPNGEVRERYECFLEGHGPSRLPRLSKHQPMKPRTTATRKPSR